MLIFVKYGIDVVDEVDKGSGNNRWPCLRKPCLVQARTGPLIPGKDPVMATVNTTSSLKLANVTRAYLMENGVNLPRFHKC